MNERRKSEWKAILSSCCGFTGEVALTDSAVILLFAAGLGAGDELAMLTTSLLPLFNGLLLIPMAALAVLETARAEPTPEMPTARAAAR